MITTWTVTPPTVVRWPVGTTPTGLPGTPVAPQAPPPATDPVSRWLRAVQAASDAVQGVR